MMKCLSVIILFIDFNSSAMGQTTIQLVLRDVAALKPEKVEVFDLSQQEIYEHPYRDTLLFHFKKTNIDCYNIRYHRTGKIYHRQIWLDTGKVRIEGHINDKDFVVDTVINSPFYYKAAAFERQYTALQKMRDTLAINNFLLAAFQENADNPFSVSVGFKYVMVNQNQKINLIKLKSIAEGRIEKFNWFLLYPVVVERIQKILTVDRIKMDSYSLLNTDKKKIRLPLTGADYYVLDLWFLACPPCLEQHVEIKKKLSLLKAKKIELIGISTDTDSKRWRDYLAKHGYNWQNYLQSGTKTITGDLSISSFPTYIVLNTVGEIVDTFNSFAEVLKKFTLN